MKEVITTFFKSLKLYFGSFPSFLKYMSFPALGQILGLLWILWAAYFYINFLPQLMKYSVFNSYAVIFLVLLIITLPGLFVMLKAFWEYLVAYGAINSMLDGLIKSGYVYDFPAHNEVITRKTSKFIGIWLVISLLATIFSFPLLIIFGAIVFVYFILVFQVFVFEPDENLFNCFKRSFQIIKGKFGKTFILMLLVGGFTMYVLPLLVNYIFEYAKITKYLAIPFDRITSLLPLEEINKNLPFRLTSLMVAQYFVQSIINLIIIYYTLPLRSICWGLWYKQNVKAKSKIDKRLLKRAEGKD